MGKGQFSWEGSGKDTMFLSDFIYKVDLYLFAQTAAWCNTLTTEQTQTQPINKNYKSLETEEQSFLKLERATAYEVTAMSRGGPRES